ncbi:hypothetical protein [Chondromyces crocatus]|uniref:hypothetical protein n=1 Tax=Chondromyces crocatus TaxID=52 RepID=UPI00067AF472|nr:hypothetical protein [Chondromyces crocatus]
MMVTVLLAYLVGRGSTPGSDANPDLAAAGHSDSMATRAVMAIARRAESAARACEISSGGAVDVMRRAYQQCGPVPPPSGFPDRMRPSDPGASPNGMRDRLPPEIPADAPASEPPRLRPVAPPPQPPPDPGGACLGACEREHRACKANQCGSEPMQSTQYKVYQDCLSTCLRAASRCRLACP